MCGLETDIVAPTKSLVNSLAGLSCPADNVMILPTIEYFTPVPDVPLPLPFPLFLFLLSFWTFLLEPGFLDSIDSLTPILSSLNGIMVVDFLYHLGFPPLDLLKLLLIHQFQLQFLWN